MEKFSKSFGYAFKGLLYAFKTQTNFKVHCFATVFVVLLGLFVELSQSEWLWIALASSTVLILELVNTAIEVLVDFVSPEQNPKAGAIKDLSAGAVLIAALMALIIGSFIFLPKLLVYVA